MSRITLTAIRRRSAFIFLPAILGLSAGCIDLTGPETERGNYYLASVNGKPPRTVIFDDEFEKVEIVKGALFLSEDGAITYTLVGVNTDKSDGSEEEVTASETGVYTRDESSLVATFDAGTYRIDMNYSRTYWLTRITFTEPDGGTMVFERIDRSGSQMGVRG